ncbi:hypothetical protein [Levilactobacillus angrenensis]|uniref:Uncharacterized protein n=1 Tax=Levilactobacillus angrenensis TaxID=2486020 RepID=A0ABW1U7I1_9LACO|nr:hypothetical protein [Levilactobacillus angrenensis]
MQRSGKRHSARNITMLVIVLALLFGLGLATTTAGAKSTNERKTHTEKVQLMKKNDRALKAATLNAKGLSIAWKDVLQHKVKLLKQLKTTIAKEKGNVYSARQVRTLTHKIDRLNKKYTHKLKKLKTHRDPASIHYARFKEKNGYTVFTKEKIKWVGNRAYVVWGIQEHDGKFINYGGHGNGFTTD